MRKTHREKWRIRTLGKAGSVFFVVFTERENETQTRLILARPVTRADKEAWEEADMPPVYDPDCPLTSPQALTEFALKVRKFRQSKKSTKPAVTIRLFPDCLNLYKALGKGCTGIMADILIYDAHTPTFLKQAMFDY